MLPRKSIAGSRIQEKEKRRKKKNKKKKNSDQTRTGAFSVVWSYIGTSPIASTSTCILCHMKTLFLPHSVKRSRLNRENKSQCVKATNQNLLWKLDSNQFSHHAPPQKHSQKSDTGKRKRKMRKKKKTEPTTAAVPRRSPFQVLNRPNTA